MTKRKIDPEGLSIDLGLLSVEERAVYVLLLCQERKGDTRLHTDSKFHLGMNARRWNRICDALVEHNLISIEGNTFQIRGRA